jgi:hypothetical protein
MPRFLGTFFVSALIAVVASHSARAEQQVFNNPQYKSLALDWCRTWGNDCGKPAADAFCAKQGFVSATAFPKADDVGVPTRIISTNQICDQPECDSFSKITCYKPDPVVDGDDDDSDGEAVTYNKPRAGGRRLDWCLTWGVNCGKPAADYFCKKRGHVEASAFKIAENIGATRILKTGEKCTMPECDGFRYITCE